MTFSTVFPSFHPRHGDAHSLEAQTFFVAKICLSLGIRNAAGADTTYPGLIWPKHHTIRAGKRWKAGDWFSARVWSGLPYRSKQIEFAQIQVKKVWDFKVTIMGDWLINGEVRFEKTENDQWREKYPLRVIAANDGLTEQDFYQWIIAPIVNQKMPPKKEVKRFEGQIICWNDQIEYT